MDTLNIDTPFPIINGVAVNTTGTIYALPAKTNTITWQLYSAVQPSAITVTLNGGLTSTELESIGSATTTTGFLTTITTNATFIQAVISGLSGGSGISVFAVAKAL